MDQLRAHDGLADRLDTLSVRLEAVHRRIGQLQSHERFRQDHAARARTAAGASDDHRRQAEDRLGLAQLRRTGRAPSRARSEAEADAELRRAFAAVLSARTSSVDGDEQQRRRELATSVVEQGWGQRERSWALAVCRAACAVLPAVEGAGLSLHDPTGTSWLLAATDPRTRAAEELHAIIGEGPTVTAFDHGAMVAAVSVADAYRRWPGFVAAAADLALGSILAVPLVESWTTVGVLTLYRPELSPFDDEVCRDARLFADLAVAVLAADLAALDDDLADPQLTALDTVQLASGMAAVQLDATVSDALARLRAHAFAEGLALTTVAEAVVARRLHLGGG